MFSEPLLVLDQRRIQAEERDQEQACATDRVARRADLLLTLQVLLAYLAGLFLIGLAFNSANPAVAGYAFVLGLVVAGVGPLVVGYSRWQRDNW